MIIPWVKSGSRIALVRGFFQLTRITEDVSQREMSLGALRIARDKGFCCLISLPRFAPLDAVNRELDRG